MMVWRCCSVVMVLLLLLSDRNARADGVDDYVRAQMAWLRIPGLSVAVIKEGRIVKAKGYGLANIETGTAATPDTVYKIASVSKQFLAAGILCLVQDKKLTLDDGIGKYLDGIPDSWQGITVRQLLSHTSGIVREPPGFDPYKEQPDAEVIRSAYPVPLRYSPGQKWEYSNTGYYCVAEIIRKVSGKPWSQFLHERLFAPAGMSATRTTTTEIVPRRASGYEVRATPQNAENWLAVRPSGAFLSTVLDFAHWDRILDSSVVLDEASRAQMWTRVRLASGAEASYGFGWFLDRVQGHRRIYHSGGVPGFVCAYQRFPDDRVSVVLMANAGSRDLSDMAVHLAGMYVPDLMPSKEPVLLDNEPAVTRKIQRILRDLTQGKVDRSQFTAPLAANLESDVKQGFADVLRKLGPVRPLALVERHQATGERAYRYQLNYRHFTLFLACAMNEENRIIRLSIQD